LGNACPRNRLCPVFILVRIRRVNGRARSDGLLVREALRREKNSARLRVNFLVEVLQNLVNNAASNCLMLFLFAASEASDHVV
jgi:hypothetical protein